MHEYARAQNGQLTSVVFAANEDEFQRFFEASGRAYNRLQAEQWRALAQVPNTVPAPLHLMLADEEHPS